MKDAKTKENQKQNYDNIDRETRYKIKKLLPKKPYATDNFEQGLKICSQKTALEKRYIELNPPAMKNFITFDLDYATWPLVSEDVNLPLPLFFVQRRLTGRAHLIYALEKPVCISDSAKFAPVRFLKNIIDAYKKRLKADVHYSGLISKNPFSDFWRVEQMTEKFYTLDELFKPVDGELYEPVIRAKKIDERETAGRHDFIFCSVKKWSYYEIKKFWGKNFSDFETAVADECDKVNVMNFSNNRLPDKEIGRLARQISRWTWGRFTPENFSAIQRNRKEKWTAKYSQKDTGLKMLELGFSTKEIANELGVSERVCRVWRQETQGKKITITESKEWEKLGISRATFYRQKKHIKIV